MSENKDKKSAITDARAKELREKIYSLCSLPSVSGFECKSADIVKKSYGELFDSVETDAVGNIILFKSSKKPNAVKIMVDAHYDEIGFVVTEVLDGGFLRLANIGGVDRAIMQAADVVVYGLTTLRGVITSVPPHLRGDSEKLPDMENMLVDVGLGYSKDELEKIVPIGTPVGFDPLPFELLNNRISGGSFDNKACGAMAILALAETPSSSLAGDVYLTLSCREETAGRGGAYVSANRIAPDYAMAIDVNLANAPDVPSRESVEMGKGISISYSSSTDRALTRAFADICADKDIGVSKKAEPSSTGTNAVAINIASLGIPVVDVGLPLRNMHTYNEIIALEDCETLCRAVKEFVTSDELAEKFAKEEFTL